MKEIPSNNEEHLNREVTPKQRENQDRRAQDKVERELFYAKGEKDNFNNIPPLKTWWVKRRIYDRLRAAKEEIGNGHPERIKDRFTGNIPNKELYRFIKHAGLEAGGTFLDLGAGGGNFTRAMGDHIGWDHPETKFIVTDKDKDAFKRLQDLATEKQEDPKVKATVQALEGDYTEKNYFEKLKEQANIDKIDGIVWANNGHYYTPADRVEYLKEMKSLLKPGAPLIIVDYNTFKQHGKDGEYNRYPLPKAQLKEELTLAGFEVEAIKRSKKLPSSDQDMMYSMFARNTSNSTKDA
jgi:SAM-dependent methyltransferase